MSAWLLLVLWPCARGIFTRPCENVDVHENFSLEEPEIVLRSELPGEVYFREDSSLQGLTIEFLGRGFEVTSVTNGTFIIGFNIDIIAWIHAMAKETSGAHEWHGLWSAVCLGLAAATRESMGLPLALFCLPGAVALDCQAPAWVMIRITYPPGFPTDGITLTGDHLVIGAEDPAPKRTEPGIYGCDACPVVTTVIHEPLDRLACHQGCEPRTDLEVETDAATMRFQGMVSGAGDGYWYVARTDGSRQGTAGDGAASGRITTNSTGNFSFLVPLFCGDQVIKVTWWNSSGPLVLVYRVRTTGCALDFLFHLDWDAEKSGHRDLDLHLLKAPGCWMRDGDTFWHNMAPAWGGKLRWDCIDDCTHETITLRNESRQSNLYYLFVHYYDGHYTSGSASVSICTRSCQIVKVRLPAVDSVKLVATIDGMTGEVNVSNRDYELTLSTFCPGMDLFETLEVLLENTTVVTRALPGLPVGPKKSRPGV